MQEPSSQREKDPRSKQDEADLSWVDLFCVQLLQTFRAATVFSGSCCSIEIDALG